ncbi:MAG: TetR/AcrR family transcriptional regulator [Microbacterium sp.]|uniref:TetR/AcrR family transcriptional regulator n=2 Tax=Microbacteriaceae TaxID=85023 RepID=A0ABT7CBJ5_9MICO|nr:TetR/AcrR family transcriptional regulator [Microbacterium sp.]MDJ1372575.1 TetR/AcrR family transcriptional regulator [Gulosibacter molinativorax]MDO8383120.1 TetR/AcrR family transcriptional regulator [Microbacterium sp.]QUY61519.1 Hypotetical protein [Gulosibacter molinativorax]
MSQNGHVKTTEQEGRRQQLAIASDPRVARTRQRIIGACRELLESDRSVTVAAICSRADVGRSTFYTHFATMGDVAVAAIDRLFDSLAAKDIERRAASTLSRAGIVRAGLEELLRAVLAERVFFLYALSAPAAERVRERFTSDLAASLQLTVRTERPDASEAFYRTAADFTANGTIGALLDWVVDPAGRSQKQMIDILSDLLPRWLVDAPLK